MSVKRATTSFSRTVRYVSTLNRYRIARLCGTVAPFRRHGPNIIKTTLLGGRTYYRLVYSSLRIRPTTRGLTCRVGNHSNLVLIASSLQTYLRNSNRSDLNNRGIFIGGNRTHLTSKALTTDVTPVGRIILRFLVGSNTSVPRIITVTAIGPTGTLNICSHVNSLRRKGRTSVAVLSDGSFRMGRAIVTKRLTCGRRTWYRRQSFPNPNHPNPHTD